MKLDLSVRLVLLQFRCSEKEPFPMFARQLTDEQPGEQFMRKMEFPSQGGVEMVIEPTMQCSLSTFPETLRHFGYELVDALCQSRINKKDKSGRKRYHMVRYTFARKEHAVHSEAFVKVKQDNEEELQDLLTENFWRAQVFKNPYFQKSEAVPGVHTISVNLVSRTPLWLPDGRLNMVWDRGLYGERIGNAPHPLRPNFQLNIRRSDGELELLP